MVVRGPSNTSLHARVSTHNMLGPSNTSIHVGVSTHNKLGPSNKSTCWGEYI